MTLLHAAALAAASAVAGAINAVAGGGTLVTFPALIALGLPAITANATSTVGLLTGTAGSITGYRREVRSARAWLPWLVPPSLAGGAAGAFLLLATPPALFADLVPFLILGATGLVVLQGRLRPPEAVRSGGATIAHAFLVAALQLVIAAYGGYFGAGIGILMLATLGFLRLPSIHVANGVKTVATACVNGVAAALFIAKGVVDWPSAVIMIAASAAGGYFGADRARRLGDRTVRGIVVTIGLIASVATGVQRIVAR
jgi:uncharacterized membrane protein YfcA